MDLFKLVAKLGLDTQEYEKGIEKAKESNKDLGSNTESATGKIQSVWSKMFSTVESDGKSKLESLSSWTLAKAKLIVDGIKNVFSKIVDLGKSAITAAADVSAEKAQFSATFEGIEEAANGVLASVSNDTGILATRLQQVGTKAFSQFKGAGLDAADALSMMDEYTRIAADAAAYYDISLEDADVRLRSFLRGNTEAGDAIGLFTSEIQRNSKAVELYGTKWTNLTEAQKQNLMLNVAQEIYDQSGATGQAAREMDGWVNVVGNLQRVWKDVLAVVGTPFYESLTPVVQKLSEFLSDETVQMRLGMLASSLGDMAGYVFDGVIDLLDKILAWSSGEEEPSDTAQALLDIASAFGDIAGMIFDGVVDFTKLLFNGLDKETAENVEEFLKDFGDFVNDPMFQAAGTTLMGMAVAWLAMHNPLVLVGAAIGIVVTHWETFEEFIDNPAFQVVSAVLAGIASGFIILKAPLVAAAGILATIVTHWEDIKRWADKAKTAFTNFINTHVPEGFMSAVTTALETVSGIVSGIQSAWNTFVESLNTTNVQKGVQSIQEGWESGGVAGAASAAWDSAWINPSNWGKNKNYGAGRSFATGLNYVPYDNFVANLHAGETVLNRADATAYRAGNIGGISAGSISQAVAVAVREALDGVGVYMGADRVGDLVTQRVSRNIAKGARTMRYANV